MSKDYTGVMLEKIYDEIKVVHELVAGQPTQVEFNELRQDVVELKEDVKTIKTAVTATNRDLDEHKRISADVAHGSGHVQRSRLAAA